MPTIKYAAWCLSVHFVTTHRQGLSIPSFAKLLDRGGTKFLLTLNFWPICRIIGTSYIMDITMNKQQEFCARSVRHVRRFYQSTNNNPQRHSEKQGGKTFGAKMTFDSILKIFNMINLKFFNMRILCVLKNFNTLT